METNKDMAILIGALYTLGEFCDDITDEDIEELLGGEFFEEFEAYLQDGADDEEVVAVERAKMQNLLIDIIKEQVAKVRG